MVNDSTHTRLTLKTGFDGQVLIRHASQRRSLVLEGENVTLHTGDILAQAGDLAGSAVIQCYKRTPEGLILSK